MIMRERPSLAADSTCSAQSGMLLRRQPRASNRVGVGHDKGGVAKRGGEGTRPNRRATWLILVELSEGICGLNCLWSFLLRQPYVLWGPFQALKIGGREIGRGRFHHTLWHESITKIIPWELFSGIFEGVRTIKISGKNDFSRNYAWNL